MTHEQAITAIRTGYDLARSTDADILGGAWVALPVSGAAGAGDGTGFDGMALAYHGLSPSGRLEGPP